MGKIMLNGVDYSAAVTGGGGREPVVVYDGSLQRYGTCSIDMEPYSKYFYEGFKPDMLISNIRPCPNYVGTIKSHYILARIIGCIDRGTTFFDTIFCREVAIAIPDTVSNVLYACGDVPCGMCGHTAHTICETRDMAATLVYPPDMYGAPDTQGGHIALTLNHGTTTNCYYKSILKIGVYNSNDLTLNKIELL